MTMSRTDVFTALRARGADRAVVAFSGGNDEGGPDSITLYTGAEEFSTLSLCGHNGEISRDAVDADEQLVDALSGPVFDEYGGFAGDFDVFGEVIWETDGETVKLLRDERASYEHSEVYL